MHQFLLHRIIDFDDKVMVLCRDNTTGKDRISKDCFCKIKDLTIRSVILCGKLSTIKQEEG